VGASQGRCKRRCRTQSQAPSHPESVGSSLAPSTAIARCVLRSHKVCNGGIELDVEVQEVWRVASAWGTSRSRDLRPSGEEQRGYDLCLVECSHRLWMLKEGDCCQRLLDLFIGKKL
jgi:hypothetical protein